jgi:hypothetical protein
MSENDSENYDAIEPDYGDGITITPEELEIVDWINDKNLERESENRRIVKEAVVQKFGDAGLKVWDLLEEPNDEDLQEAEEDCPDCGQISDEWIERTKLKMEQFELFIDDTLDDIVTLLISAYDGTSIPAERIDDEAQKLGETKEEIKLIDEKIRKKILFAGIVDGWLVDEYFSV